MITDTNCETSTTNMSIWDKVRTPPDSALKEIKGGRLKGFTDIDPMWRIQAMTENFGMCGIGWKYTIDKQWIENGSENQITAFTNISLFYKVDDVWSEAIPGNGGSMLVEKESKGPHTSDECYKMALTDALSVAMKALGFGADIYMSGKVKGDGSKYGSAQKTPDCPKCKKNVTVFADKNEENSFYCWKKKEGCGHKWHVTPEKTNAEKATDAEILSKWKVAIEKVQDPKELMEWADKYGKSVSKLPDESQSKIWSHHSEWLGVLEEKQKASS